LASVRWTLNANTNLLMILQFLADRSPGYMAGLYERISTSVLRLEQFPRMGRVVREYRDESLRELIVDSYRVIYSVEQSEVGILAVIHTSRNLTRALGPSPREIGSHA
jgi:toxin ParE1/3/4